VTEEIHSAVKMSIASAAAREATTLAVGSAAGVAARAGILSAAGAATTSALPAIAVGAVAYGLYSFIFSKSAKK